MFHVFFDDFSAMDPWSARGPMFHRWLPDGEADAISLQTADSPKSDLSVWFERRGYMDGNRIKYDHERHEIDAAKTPWNGSLCGGYLTGLLVLYGLSEEGDNGTIEARAPAKRCDVMCKWTAAQ